MTGMLPMECKNIDKKKSLKWGYFNDVCRDGCFSHNDVARTNQLQYVTNPRFSLRKHTLFVLSPEDIDSRIQRHPYFKRRQKNEPCDCYEAEFTESEGRS